MFNHISITLNDTNASEEIDIVPSNVLYYKPAPNGGTMVATSRAVVSVRETRAEIKDLINAEIVSASRLLEGPGPV